MATKEGNPQNWKRPDEVCTKYVECCMFISNKFNSAIAHAFAKT